MSEEQREEPVKRRLSVREMAGVLGPDWTGGMSSVDWVRAQRDDAPKRCHWDECPHGENCVHAR